MENPLKQAGHSTVSRYSGKEGEGGLLRAMQVTEDTSRPPSQPQRSTRILIAAGHGVGDGRREGGVCVGEREPIVDGAAGPKDEQRPKGLDRLSST